MVGHITAVTSSVFVHALLFGAEEDETKAARLQLASYFNTLVNLRHYWLALGVCFARLRTFHELCRESVDPVSG